MRIAITGAAGYIGGWLCTELKARGHEVHATDRRSPGGMRAHDTWTGFDLADGRARWLWLSSYRPEVVIHLAALYGRLWGEADLDETARVNAGLTAELARNCSGPGLDGGTRLVYVSSSEVYGAAADRAGPVRADAPLAPRNMYGLSKKWGEEAARAYAPDGLVIARLNMPYGPSAVPPLPGEVPATSDAVGSHGYNVLHTMLWQAHHGKDITVHRGAERCMTWAGDAVRGLALITEAGQSGTWNVCRDDEHVPVAEIAAKAVALTGSSSRVTETDPPPGVTLRKHLDAGPLYGLGWKPEVSLDEGMARSLAHYSRFNSEGHWRA